MSQRLILTIENRGTHLLLDRNLGFESPGVTCHTMDQSIRVHGDETFPNLHCQVRSRSELLFYQCGEFDPPGVQFAFNKVGLSLPFTGRRL